MTWQLTCQGEAEKHAALGTTRWKKDYQEREACVEPDAASLPKPGRGSGFAWAGNPTLARSISVSAFSIPCELIETEAGSLSVIFFFFCNMKGILVVSSARVKPYRS